MTKKISLFLQHLEREIFVIFLQGSTVKVKNNQKFVFHLDKPIHAPIESSRRIDIKYAFFKFFEVFLRSKTSKNLIKIGFCFQRIT
jgi:hypothetical protein